MTSSKTLSTALVLGIVASGPHAFAALYTNDFSGVGGNTAFPTETTDPQWALNSGTYRNSYSGPDIASSVAVSVPTAAGTDFSLSTQFTIVSTTAPTASLSTAGFAALGATNTFGGAAGTAYYLADFAYANQAGHAEAGRLRILSLGDSSGYSSVASLGNFDDNTTSVAIQIGTTYTLTLTGTYNGSGHLSMALGLYDETGTTQIGTNATAIDTSPLTGEFFGYRNRTGGGSPQMTADFDNFALVPEPATALLASLGSLALLRRRRS